MWRKNNIDMVLLKKILKKLAPANAGPVEVWWYMTWYMGR